MARLDAHCHIWALGRGDYGWLDQSDTAMAPIAQDFVADDLKMRLQAAGISQSIVVQAAPTEGETIWLLEQARAVPHIAGIVGWVDLTRDDLAARLTALAADPALRGIRPMLQDLAPDWLGTAPVAGWAEAVQDARLRFDALVRPAHLATLVEVMGQHPGLSVVIDHAAKPVLAAPPDDPRHALWREGMERLAGETGAYCKLSGLLTEMSAADLPQARDILFPLMDQLLRWFGADRLMWGSDWPVLRLAGSYAGWADLCAEWMSAQTADAQAKIRGQTGRRFYGLDGGAP